MSERRPAPRPSSRRGPTAPLKLKTGPDIKKFAPYIVAGVTIAGLVLLARTPRYTTIGAFAIGMVILGALGWVALSYRISLAPDDRLRVLLPAVTVIALAAAAAPLGYTLFPPAPRATIALAAPGDARSVQLAGNVAAVWLAVSGRFARNSTGTADYFLTVAHNGGPPQRVDGTLHPGPGGPPPDRTTIPQHGPGRYTIRLEAVSQGLALPVTVQVHVKPLATLMLILLYAAIAVGVLAVDTMLWRRGIEPSFAAAMLVPLVAAVYFQRNPAADAPTNDLLAAGVIGAIGGGLGGELLARAARLVAGK